MKGSTLTVVALATAALMPAVARGQQSDARIRVTKDAPGEIASTPGATNSDIQFTGPLGYRLRPGAAPLLCSPGDAEDVQNVQIKTELYQPGMITPEQAKALALCAVPGQIGSGEMETSGGRPIYDISLIPTDKKTYTKIQIDAYTGEVVNSKQFGGLRGLAGFLRESYEHKENKQP